MLALTVSQATEIRSSCTDKHFNANLVLDTAGLFSAGARATRAADGRRAGPRVQTLQRAAAPQRPRNKLRRLQARPGTAAGEQRAATALRSAELPPPGSSIPSAAGYPEQGAPTTGFLAPADGPGPCPSPDERLPYVSPSPTVSAPPAAAGESPGPPLHTPLPPGCAAGKRARRNPQPDAEVPPGAPASARAPRRVPWRKAVRVLPRALRNASPSAAIAPACRVAAAESRRPAPGRRGGGTASAGGGAWARAGEGPPGGSAAGLSKAASGSAVG